MNKRYYYNFVLFLLLICSSSSCVSQKEVVYFQADQAAVNTQNIEQKHVSKLQPGDILSIMVSSLSPEASAMFNPYQQDVRPTQIQTTQTTAPVPASGYLINEEGFVILPLVGKVKLAGLSTSQATDLVTQELDKFLQQPTINIRILNFKISVLGEVARPALYTIPNEKITLPEAIALAGDLTIFGKRDNVHVIREIDGKRVFAHVDLTKRDVFNSPYYYLQANDVVYVEPTRSRVLSSDRTVQLIPVFLSGISLLTVLVVNLMR